MRLIIGPSNSGKSSWLAKNNIANPVFAYQVQGRKMPGNDAVLHYNSLFLAPERIKLGQGLQSWDLLDDRLLRRCIEKRAITEAIITIAPISHLLERASQRLKIEPKFGVDEDYSDNLWLRILENVDHFAAYQQIVDMLEANGIPYQILYNDNTTGQEFLPSDRCYIHHNLRGRYVELPSETEIYTALDGHGVKDLAVRLPQQRDGHPSANGHNGGARSISFNRFKSRSLVGASVLDIGCALGDMLFRHERYGATALTGIDMREKRLDAAAHFAKVLHSNADFHHGEFVATDNLEPHDEVLALNVIHHVWNFYPFLEKAMSLAKKRLVLEYPTLADQRFQRLGRVPSKSDRHPFIGVSGSSVGQSYVFSPAAIERVMANFGDFAVTHIPSPMQSRMISVFART